MTQLPGAEDPNDVSLGPVIVHEGEYVRQMEGKLPVIPMDMAVAYPRGAHVQMAVEARVRHINYREDKDGNLVRVHQFALEELRLVDAFDPARRPQSSLGGNLSGNAWREQLDAYIEGRTDDLQIDPDDDSIPDRVRDIMLRLRELDEIRELNNLLPGRVRMPEGAST